MSGEPRALLIGEDGENRLMQCLDRGLQIPGNFASPLEDHAN